VSQIIVSDKTFDIFSSSFGIQTIRYDKEMGFFLNNKSLGIKSKTENELLADNESSTNMETLNNQNNYD
jgi:hypothetical protein